jgi:hypothetical protein
MRTLFLLLLFSFGSGCVRHTATAHHPESADLFSPVTAQELETAKRNLHLLQADMTDEAVFNALGLSRFQREGTLSGGPGSYHWDYYTLRRDPPLTLGLIHDYTSPPGTRKLVNVIFDGASWKEQPKGLSGF